MTRYREFGDFGAGFSAGRRSVVVELQRETATLYELARELGSTRLQAQAAVLSRFARALMFVELMF
jgi:hypothetical protein